MITKDDLVSWIRAVDKRLDKKIVVIAVGGTAMTLLGLKSSTRDVDFCVFSKDKKEFEGALDDKFPVDVFLDGYIFCLQLPDDYSELRDDYASFSDTRDELGRCVDLARRSLSWGRRLFNRKETIATKEILLRAVEGQIKPLILVMDQALERYEAMSQFVQTDKGVYVSIDPDVQGYVDLDFKHTEVSAPGNTLNGKLVVFSLSEKGYRWGLTTEGNDAGRHGEDAQLSMDVPYNQLTKVANIGRSQYDVELSARVLAGIRNHHCNVENGIATSGRFSAGTLDFPDARYRVMCTIMSSETDNLGEPIPVGTTNAQRYTAHSGPQGYDIDDVQVGLCARVLKGTNTFELNFYRIKSMEKV